MPANDQLVQPVLEAVGPEDAPLAAGANLGPAMSERVASGLPRPPGVARFPSPIAEGDHDAFLSLRRWRPAAGAHDRPSRRGGRSDVRRGPGPLGRRGNPPA